jgi:hypothetical protein
MYQFWSGDGFNTPAQLSTKAVSSKVQWFLVFHQDIQSYIVLHYPFIYPAAPGLNHHPRSNQITWVINEDIGTTGTSLSLVNQPGNIFHLVNTLVLPSDDNFTALMSTAAPGASEVAQVADPAAAGWLPPVSTPRHWHPLPHKFVVRALLLAQGGRVDHKLMWEGLASNILSKVNEMAAHRSLLDFLKVTALRRSPVAGQGVDRPAETQLSFSATFVDDTIRNQAGQIKTARLPGLVPVTDAMAQLATL